MVVNTDSKTLSAQDVIRGQDVRGRWAKLANINNLFSFKFSMKCQRVSPNPKASTGQFQSNEFLNSYTTCFSWLNHFPLSRLFLQDLGLLGTSLNDILYKNAAFLNLVDPISHELLLSLARDLQCPKRVNNKQKQFFVQIMTGFRLISRTRLERRHVGL